MTERCQVPPPGWYCTRTNGHDGPCAALRRDPWWHSLLTVVSRESYIKAVRALSDARAAYHDEKAENAQLHELLGAQKELIEGLREDRQARIEEMTEARAALLQLPVFEGLVGPAPLGMMVSGLAQDHEELESRIESVLDLILTRRDIDLLDIDSTEYATLNRIAGLLQGAVDRVPDTPEGL